MTYSGVLGDSRCECSDLGCPVHVKGTQCVNVAIEILYRIDMEDNTGTAFCEQCAEDAFESGLFTNRIKDNE